MKFIIDEFGVLTDEQAEWLRAHLRAQGMVEASVDELVDVGGDDDLRVALDAANAEVERLSVNCAALLQRWAIVYNMCRSGDSADNIAAVAQLSAEEVVARGLDYCGERLLRYEKGGHVLRAMKGFLDEGRSVNPGSPQHLYIKETLSGLSSYSREQVAAGAV
jgi:hypothetical protein